MSDDRRLIEDYIPLESLSEQCGVENRDRGGKIDDIHLWWARRRLVSARAAVFASLVPAAEGKNGRGGKSRFVSELCTYPAQPDKVAAAENQLLDAHAARLGCTAKAIREGTFPRPRVLDPFAGGGALPLEAARLGCESHALDLNPVAHVVQMMTLVYSRRYGSALAADVDRWGTLVLQRSRPHLADMYPTATAEMSGPGQLRLDTKRSDSSKALFPIAYVWTRTVQCKRPDCGAAVPLARQSWLSRQKGEYVAVRQLLNHKDKAVAFDVVTAQAAADLGFDPDVGSTGGNATCPFCHSVADDDHVKAEGKAGRMRRQLMAVVCTTPGRKGKTFLSPSAAGEAGVVNDEEALGRIEMIASADGITAPDEPLPAQGTLGFRVQAYGFKQWRDLFTPRQLLSLMVFAREIRHVHSELIKEGCEKDRARAIATGLTCVLDRFAHFNSTICILDPSRSAGVKSTFLRTALPMTWDFPESNPFNTSSSGWLPALKCVVAGIMSVGQGTAVNVQRGSATELPYGDGYFDAIVTDPPYYDNVPYADLSDFFYVWMKRTVGDLYPQEFATPLVPKRKEAIAEPARHGGNKNAARAAYENMMAQAFSEMNRVLKPGGPLVCVYAHKTVAGWATVIDALRRAAFVVVEAWPLRVENPGRIRANDSAALASSIFLVARRREGKEVGSYETQVRSDLEAIVRERTDTLWKEGVTGADLVIACVGAGLRAFTKYERVEFDNGEEVPADRFIIEVEGAVLETVLSKVGVRDADPATKFYLAWRLQYRASELDAGEAIVFAYPLGVELDGADGLTTGARALLTKRGSKMQIRDFTERGAEDKLGLPDDERGKSAPLIDVLHRVLYLMEHKPAKLRDFIDKARPDGERLRLVAQALAGKALQGGELDGDVAGITPEQSAVRKLIANWRSVFEDSLFSARGA